MPSQLGWLLMHQRYKYLLILEVHFVLYENGGHLLNNMVDCLLDNVTLTAHTHLHHVTLLHTHTHTFIMSLYCTHTSIM